jgi:hypothetical protein
VLVLDGLGMPEVGMSLLALHALDADDRGIEVTADAS